MNNVNSTEKRTLNLWYAGLLFGAAAFGISLYSLYLYHKDLEEKYKGRVNYRQLKQTVSLPDFL